MEKKKNRLAACPSPYLRQHAANPVDWHPWGDEAFARAVSEDKPIFLSIGYSTCHWCHRMADESFEDQAVAELMNATFVNIKVDREELPQVDAICMKVCQMLIGGGGWPLNIIMTPDKKPFFAATYLPRQSSFGRFGMLELVPRIRETWENRRRELDETGAEVLRRLGESLAVPPAAEIDATILDAAYGRLCNGYDAEHGGFGDAPKFASPHNLMFLVDYWRRTQEPHALEMAVNTLKAIRCGGIFDQIGYGVHRYSTDKAWLVPHFEKMLYDQAMLLMACAAVAEIQPAAGFVREMAAEICTYVLRDLSAENGAFYCAEDADSEGLEGKFYLWDVQEIMLMLEDEADVRLFLQTFRLRPDGNFPGSDIFNLPHLADLPDAAATARLKPLVAKVLAAREQRSRPFRDEKILADWNALMIAALAMAGRVFGEAGWIAAAERTMGFILENMSEPDGRLWHVRSGDGGVAGLLDDYAFVTWALLELRDATGDPAYQAAAGRFADQMLAHFRDDRGGLWTTADDRETVMLRNREIYDLACPCGASAAYLNLLRLAEADNNDGPYAAAAQAVLDSLSAAALKNPGAHTFLMRGLCRRFR